MGLLRIRIVVGCVERRSGFADPRGVAGCLRAAATALAPAGRILLSVVVASFG